MIEFEYNKFVNIKKRVIDKYIKRLVGLGFLVIAFIVFCTIALILFIVQGSIDYFGQNSNYQQSDNIEIQK